MPSQNAALAVYLAPHARSPTHGVVRAARACDWLLARAGVARDVAVSRPAEGDGDLLRTAVRRTCRDGRVTGLGAREARLAPFWGALGVGLVRARHGVQCACALWPLAAVASLAVADSRHAAG